MVKDWKVFRAIIPWKRPYHLIRAKIAKFWIKRFPKVEVIGVTGSVGKTTTKEAIAQVLSAKFNVLKTIENFDPLFNIPKTLLKVGSGTQKVILEMGVEHPGEMDFYLSLVKPKTGVVTQIFLAHTAFLGDINGILAEKGKLLEVLPKDGWAILNWDDENVRKLAKRTRAKVFWYGTSSKECDLWVEEFSQGFSGSKFTLCTNQGKEEVKWRLIGEHNTVSALASASVGLVSGLKLKEICQSLSKFEPQKSRVEVKRGVKSTILLDDCYNASPLSTEMSLKTLKDLAKGRRKVAVLGDMLELGAFSESAHRELGEEVLKNKIDLLFCVGENSKFTYEVVSKVLGERSSWTENIYGLAQKVKQEIQKNDVVLVKGSRAVHLEKIVKELAL